MSKQYLKIWTKEHGGSFVLNDESFKDYAFTVSGGSVDSIYGFVKKSGNTGKEKYHLWFVKGDIIFQHLYNSTELKNDSKELFPSLEEFNSNPNMRIIIDRRVEHCGSEIELIGDEFEKQGYDKNRIYVIGNSYNSSQKNLIGFCHELMYNAYRIQLSNTEFGHTFASEQRDLINITDLSFYERKLPEIEFKKWLLDLSFMEEKRPYKFLYYNAVLHDHRLAGLYELHNRGLEKYALFSAVNRDRDSKEELRNRLSQFIFDYPISKEEKQEFVEKSNFIDNLPVSIDSAVVGYPQYFNEMPKKEHYVKTYFSLIAETTFSTEETGVTRLTEKTIKPAILHPFILLGTYKSLEFFRSFGFKTFPDLFNEKYDDIEDDRERLSFVMSEVERVCNLPETELHKKILGLRNTIEYNQKVLLNINLRKMIKILFSEIVND